MGVNDILRAVENLKGFENSKAKGDKGEEAVIEVLKGFVKRMQSDNPNDKFAVWQSLVYPLASDKDGHILPGNFELREDGLYQSTSGNTGEIDVFFLTPYRLFIIEVKTYNAYVEVDDLWTNKGQSPNSLSKIDWCNLCQVEKSARHMYAHLYMKIPEGDPDFIVPILCYAQGKIKVSTSDYNVTTLNGLNQKISKLIPYKYRINCDEFIKEISSRFKGRRLL